MSAGGRSGAVRGRRRSSSFQSWRWKKLHRLVCGWERVESREAYTVATACCVVSEVVCSSWDRSFLAERNCVMAEG